MFDDTVLQAFVNLWFLDSFLLRVRLVSFQGLIWMHFLEAITEEKASYLQLAHGQTGYMKMFVGLCGAVMGKNFMQVWKNAAH